MKSTKPTASVTSELELYRTAKASLEKLVTCNAELERQKDELISRMDGLLFEQRILEHEIEISRLRLDHLTEVVLS